MAALAPRYFGGRFEIRDSDGHVLKAGPVRTSGWSCHVVNERPQSAREIERGLRFEFDLPRPGGKRYGRADDIVAAVPRLGDGGGED